MSDPLTEFDKNEEIQQATIKSMDELVARIIMWHTNGMAQAEHMLTIPEGTEAEYPNHKGKPITIKLTGKVLQAFRFGIMTGIDAFMKLPIAYVEEDKEPANEPTTDTPKGE